MQPGEQRSYQPRYDDQSHGQTAPDKRARGSLVLLTALLVELIVIAGALNQWVARHIADEATRHGRLVNGVIASALTYRWLFSPETGDHAHVWLGELGLIGTTLVVSLLLIATVARGPITWTRAFFGTWMSVLVATLLGQYVCALIVKAPGGGGVATRTLFGPLAPGSQTVLAGLALGVVVALVVSIVAATTRRAPDVVTDPAPDAPGDSIFTAGRPDGGSQQPPPAPAWASGSGAPLAEPHGWGQDVQQTSRLPTATKQDAAYDSSSDPEAKAPGIAAPVESPEGGSREGGSPAGELSAGEPPAGEAQPTAQLPVPGPGAPDTAAGPWTTSEPAQGWQTASPPTAQSTSPYGEPTQAPPPTYGSSTFAPPPSAPTPSAPTPSAPPSASAEDGSATYPPASEQADAEPADEGTAASTSPPIDPPGDARSPAEQYGTTAAQGQQTSGAHAAQTFPRPPDDEDLHPDQH